MRIAGIEVHRVDLPCVGGVYRLSGGRTCTGFDATIVRPVTDDGHEGWWAMRSACAPASRT